MRTYQLVQMILWILPLCLQPLIALVMTVRRHVTDFPVFFLYTLFVAGRDLALFFLRSHMRRYSWIYWVGEPLSIILGLAAICEVVWHLIQPYPTLRFLGVRLFWMTFIITFVAGVLMLNPSQFVRTTIQIESAILLERSARFIQVGILVVFILFISRLGLTWKHYAAGIVAGFGIAAGFQLALVELKSLHAIANNIFVLLNSAAYNCAVLIWATYFFPSRMQKSQPMELPKSDLPKWDELLRRYLRK